MASEPPLTLGDSAPAANMTVVRPRRVHLKHTKGYRKPANCLSVGRPTQWGNRYVIGRAPVHLDGHRVVVLDREHAFRLYREWLDDQLRRFPDLLAHIRGALGGRDLGCFCPSDGPCHADVLLDLANSTDSGACVSVVFGERIAAD